MKKGLWMGLAAAAVLSTACSPERLNIPNENTATQTAAAGAPGALQLQITGIFRQLRNGRGAMITAFARFGREGYIYTPNEGRNTSHFLIGLVGANRLDPSGFAVGVFGGPYGNLRDIFVVKNAVTANTALSATQSSALMGMLRTIEALELSYVLQGRDSIGIVVAVNPDPQELEAFVSRDSAFRYILNTLDQAHAQLLAGPATFGTGPNTVLSMHSGFAGFSTPATFAQFNRAIATRVAVQYATLGGGAATWTRAAASLVAAGAFYNRTATTAAQMNVGVYHPYSTATGDAGNGIDSVSNADFLGHPSLRTDAQFQLAAPTVRDARFEAKTFTLTNARNAPQGLGIATSIGFRIYQNQSTPVPIIRNEELILLDAEIRNNTGDPTGAIQNINQVRTNRGLLAPSTLTPASTQAAITAGILYEKRYSLLGEGHRWVDVRRYGLLNTLPLDSIPIPPPPDPAPPLHFRAKVMPVPQAECLARVGLGAALAGPGC